MEKILSPTDRLEYQNCKLTHALKYDINFEVDLIVDMIDICSWIKGKFSVKELSIGPYCLKSHVKTLLTNNPAKRPEADVVTACNRALWRKRKTLDTCI